MAARYSYALTLQVVAQGAMAFATACTASTETPPLAAPVSTSAQQRRQSPTCRYDVTPRDARGATLDVRLRCDGVRVTHLRIASSMANFVRVHGPLQTRFEADAWWLPEATSPLDVRYEVALGDAARSFDDVDVAVRRGNSLLAPMSSWLLRPAPLPANVEIPVRFHGDTRVVTSLPGPSAREGVEFSLASHELKVATYAAFGAVDEHRVDVFGADGATARVRVAVLDGQLEVPRDTLLAWVRDGTSAVVRFWGELPMDPTLLMVVPVANRERVVFGKLLPAGGATIALFVGEHASHDSLYDDWILVHELFHTGFPSFVGEGKWLDEGLATYFEPLIRARAGWIDDPAVWSEFHQNLPKGLRACEVDGLERTRDYGGVYWGGAIVALLADASVRAASGGTRGLEHGLRALLRQGGHAGNVWTLDAAIRSVDEALGSPVLAPLAQAHARGAGPTHLREVLKRLGVERGATRVHLRDDTQDSAVRRAIVRGDLGATSDNLGLPVREKP